MGVYEVVVVGLLLFPWSFVAVMFIGALWRGGAAGRAQARGGRLAGRALRLAPGEICR